MPTSRRFPEFALSEAPEWALVRQELEDTGLGDVAAAVQAAMAPPLAAIPTGSTVCLAVGSRGIDRILEVVRAAVATIRQAGLRPFVVPAMGSHGGATADGQLEVLASYGITQASIGCEIRSSMATVEIGEVEPGVPVHVDRHAMTGADCIIPINRVKPHTDFTGPVGSGLLKMIAIGLGKQHGADTFHGQGFHRFEALIPAVAAFTLQHAPIPFGLALIENGAGRLAQVEAVPADAMVQRDRELLALARSHMPRIPVEAIDVLIVDEIGKDVSGIGMDTNVIGRYYTGPTGQPPAIQRIIVRGLTDRSDGNAAGIGLADVVLRRAVERIDTHATWMNAITARTPEGARVGITVDTDREAIEVALACCLRVTPSTAKVVRIRSTARLDRLYVSAPALPDVAASDRCRVVRPPARIRFDEAGMLADGWDWDSLDG